MEPGLQAAAISVGVVAVLCGVIAVGAWGAMVRTGNRTIRLVVIAFALLSAKNLIKAVRQATGGREGTLVELAFSLVDLAAVALIAWPMVMRRRP